MCQVNTDPMRSRQGYLQVVGMLNSRLILMASVCLGIAEYYSTL